MFNDKIRHHLYIKLYTTLDLVGEHQFRSEFSVTKQTILAENPVVWLSSAPTADPYLCVKMFSKCFHVAIDVMETKERIRIVAPRFFMMLLCRNHAAVKVYIEDSITDPAAPKMVLGAPI